MNRTEFVRLVGDQIAHCTYRSNAESILAHGLMSPQMLSNLAGLNPELLVLRKNAPDIAMDGRQVRLNHQLPLLKGRRQSFLDGHTIESWSAQLDRRIFFLPQGLRAKDSGFVKSLGPETTIFLLDAAAFYDALVPDIWLSPINSGNADRKPAHRGDWIYVPVTARVEAFRQNRINRNLVSSPDSVAEISTLSSVAPDLLRRLISAQ